MQLLGVEINPDLEIGCTFLFNEHKSRAVVNKQLVFQIMKNQAVVFGLGVKQSHCQYN